MLFFLVILIALGLIGCAVVATTREVKAWQKSKNAPESTMKKWVWFSGIGVGIFVAPIAYVIARIFVSIILGAFDVSDVLAKDGGINQLFQMWEVVPNTGSIMLMIVSGIVCVLAGLLVHRLAKRSGKSTSQYVTEKFDDDTPVDYDQLDTDAQRVNEKRREYWNDSTDK